MSCEPERITALVDGALDAREAARLQAHAASCTICRSQLAAERAIQDRLRGLPRAEPPAGFERRLRQRLRARTRPVPFASAALALAASLLIAFWVRGYAPFVAWELSRDHDHCYAHATPPALVRSGEPDEVAGWFAARGTPLVRLPRRFAGAALRGGRFCYLPDVSTVPHLYYFDAERALSLFLVPHGVRVDDGAALATRGNTVAFVRRRDALFGVVGARPTDVAAAVRELRASAGADERAAAR